MKFIKILACAFLFGTLSCGPVEDKIIESEMQHIEDKVAQDAVEQYQIAYRQGDKMQIYVQAGLVAACYLQAKDEANYNKWKEIEKAAEKEAMADAEKQFQQ